MKILIATFLVLNLFGNKSNDNCTALKKILTSQEVIKHFRLSEISDSTKLTLIDRNNNFANCQIDRWEKKSLILVYDTAITNKIRRVEPKVMFGTKCQYFIIMDFKKRSNEFFFSILQPCSGLVYSATVVKKGAKFEIEHGRRGVI